MQHPLSTLAIPHSLTYTPKKAPSCRTHTLRLGNVGGVGGHVLGLLVVVGLLGGILLLAALLVLLLFRLLILVFLDGCLGDELFEDEVVALFLGCARGLGSFESVNVELGGGGVKM